MGGSVFLGGSVVIFGSSVSLPHSYAIWCAPGTLGGSSTHQYVLVHAVRWSHSSSSSPISFLSHTPTCPQAHRLSQTRVCCLLCRCPLPSFSVPFPPRSLTPADPAPVWLWVVRPSWGLCLGPALAPSAEKVLVARTGPGRDPSLEAGAGRYQRAHGLVPSGQRSCLSFKQGPKALLLDSHTDHPSSAFNLRHHASYSVLPFWFWKFSRRKERRWYLCFPWLNAPCDDWGICLIFEFLLTLPAIAVSLLWHLSEAAAALSDCFLFSSVQYFPFFFKLKKHFT